MKDYTFGNETYKQNFILYYTREENNRYLVAHLANGKIETYENTLSNERALLKRMGIQIEIANKMVHSETIDYSKIHFFEYLKKYVMVQSVLKDIEKNKLILDNADYINEALAYDKEWTRRLPLYLQDHLLWGSPIKGFGSFHFTLNEADAFTLGEITTILETADHYCMLDSLFPKRKLINNNEEQKRV